MYFKLEKKDYPFKTLCVSKLLPIPNMHSHIEIAFIKKDGKTLAFADEKKALIEENDLFISFPYQIHFYEDIATPSPEYVVILISPELCPEFKEIFKTKLPKNHVIKNAGKNPLILTAIETLISCTNNTEPYVETLARGVALMLLSEIFKVTSFSEIQTHNVDILKKILNYCYENFTNDISLDDISKELHIGRYYISRIFNQKFHMGFIEFINSLRIKKARELLTLGEYSITEIAFMCGYNSVRSFNRCFRKSLNTSPRKFQLDFLEKSRQENL